ncbi:MULTISPECIES: VOC family protein [Amycolatopsis]|uniref:VOC family protein n=1 Tax=Amycolatopsis TaxID=1813 RepID=UPI0007DF548F|nr:VOC family protein [Amycolatopsis sp. M39]OAP19927.1 Manganese-dependent 2,3-dihydroxybiphenyl 1,2-dioxygenase [Amycolatopsis sp. M39]
MARTPAVSAPSTAASSSRSDTHHAGSCSTLGIGVYDPDDLDRVADSLHRLGVEVERSTASVDSNDPGTGVRVHVEIAPRIASDPSPAPAYNRPGEVTRPGARADAVLRDGPVRPRKLGHVVLGSTDQESSQRFFTDGIGLKISDTVPGIAAFLRCSTDHHNVLVQSAPVGFLHHTSWQVDDVDEVGRGATAMLEADPRRHVWGLGRHAIGSNFFWYLKDPAGNFSEYYSDIDCIIDDALWTPGVWEGTRSLYQWGPPPPPSFLAPDDLAALMTGAHSA